MSGVKKRLVFYISIGITIILIAAVLLSKLADKEYYIFAIIGILLAFNSIVIEKKLCLYRETSPKWLKISIKTISTLAAFSLVYLVISIFIPTLPILEIIEMVCQISIGASILLILAERKIFGVIDNSRDLLNDN